MNQSGFRMLLPKNPPKLPPRGPGPCRGFNNPLPGFPAVAVGQPVPGGHGCGNRNCQRISDRGKMVFWWFVMEEPSLTAGQIFFYNRAMGIVLMNIISCLKAICTFIPPDSFCW